MSHDMNGIINRLKYLIDKHGGNQSKFARLVGMQQANISKILSGGRTCDQAVINKIAISLDINPEWLATGEGELKKTKTLPHIPFRAAAGYLGVEAESIDLRDAPHHAQIDFFDRYDMTITVDGMSMYPRFVTGDILAIERIERGAAYNGGTYVVATREGAVVKVVEQSGDYLRLIPLNKDYPTTQAHWDSVLGLYRIVGMLRTDIP